MEQEKLTSVIERIKSPPFIFYDLMAYIVPSLLLFLYLIFSGFFFSLSDIGFKESINTKELVFLTIKEQKIFPLTFEIMIIFSILFIAISWMIGLALTHFSNTLLEWWTIPRFLKRTITKGGYGKIVSFLIGSYGLEKEQINFVKKEISIDFKVNLEDIEKIRLTPLYFNIRDYIGRFNNYGAAMKKIIARQNSVSNLSLGFSIIFICSLFKHFNYNIDITSFIFAIVFFYVQLKERWWNVAKTVEHYYTLKKIKNK